MLCWARAAAAKKLADACNVHSQRPASCFRRHAAQLACILGGLCSLLWHDVKFAHACIHMLVVDHAWVWRALDAVAAQCACHQHIIIGKLCMSSSHNNVQIPWGCGDTGSKLSAQGEDSVILCTPMLLCRHHHGIISIMLMITINLISITSICIIIGFSLSLSSMSSFEAQQ